MKFDTPEEAIKYIRSKGGKVIADGRILYPLEVIDSKFDEAIDYLCNEWDFMVSPEIKGCSN